MLKIKLLRILAFFKQKKLNRLLNNLSEEQSYVYKITIKLISLPNSKLEISPESGIFHIKSNSMLLVFDAHSIHFVNGTNSYCFSYDYYLMQNLRNIFHRRKEITVKNMVCEVTVGTTTHLKNIYSSLNSTEQ